MRYIFLISFLMQLALSAMAPMKCMAAESTPVRGTRVTMECPNGFEAASNFSGFGNKAVAASIMVTEMPIPFDAATKGYTKEGLESKGMKLISKDPVESGAYKGFILDARQSAGGVEFCKWINVFGDSAMTVLVTGSYPASQSEALSKPIKDAVLSARFDAQAKIPGLMDDLPFTVSGTTTLKLAGRIQNTLLLTPSGKMTPPASEENKSVFVVGQALSDIEVGDKSTFARNRLQKTDALTDIKIIDEKDTTVAGMPAREIRATGKGKSGEDIFILQTIAYGRGSYFIMQGLTDVSKKTRMEFEFRSVIKSLKLKDATT